MKDKLFDYTDTDNIIFNLSGLTKLICFLCLTFCVMFSYDVRYIIGVLLFSMVIFKMSEVSLQRIKLMLLYVLVFLIMNFILTFLFSPQHALGIYGTKNTLFVITERYIVTQEQLLYQLTKTLKYASVVPLGMLFLLTTNPSEFAASLNRIGVNYKGAFAVSLTLRYFPDMIRDYQNISLAQQSRGLDLSKKEKLSIRLKNIMNICIPLIFSTLDRVEVISNAMDLRGFGKNKKRTWYVAKQMKTSDKVAILISLLIFLGSLFLTFFVNQSRFWNPFI
jgi:ABC-type cobalt transport system, permease component CbiQ and related transporters